MRFKLDENLPLGAAELLTTAGHDALTIHDQQMVGEPVPRVAAVCLEEQRALVTLDLDFSEIRTYPPGDYVGIIVLRPHMQGRQAVLNLFARFVPLLTVEPLAGNLRILHEFNMS